MKVLLVQFEPKYKTPKESRKRAEKVIKKYHGKLLKGVDIILLPEMAFSGYNFKTREDIKEVAIESEQESIEFAKKYSTKYKTGVVIGYPRYDKDKDLCFNSQLVMNPNAEIISVYDKCFLYYNDKTWATEGNCFKIIELPWINKKNGESVKAVQAICMDINPKDFEAPSDKYELASFVKAEKADVILFSSAWTTEEPDTNDSLRHIQYWASRLTPLLDTNCFFICSNRIGEEDKKLWNETLSGKTKFVGRSCVIDLKKRTINRVIKGSKQDCRLVTLTNI